MFSFAGDTVLDPFLGTGSTTIAAIRAGRNSVGSEIEPKYLKLAWERVRKELDQPRLYGSCEAALV
jgi:modification methylase